jgi:predicted RNase H-like HicB family nuclease
MAPPVKRYTVRYERDEDGWWVATVKGVRGCHTQGRTIEEAERRAREALGLFVDGAESATLEREVRLPAKIRQELKRLSSAKKRADRANAAARTLRRKTVIDLRKKLGLSVRDAGTLLGLSGQRVQQLSEG